MDGRDAEAAVMARSTPATRGHQVVWHQSAEPTAVRVAIDRIAEGHQGQTITAEVMANDSHHQIP